MFFCFTILGGIAAAQQPDMKQVPDGQKTKLTGMITNRTEESFVMITMDNTALYKVQMTPETSVKSNTRGLFRGGTNYGASYLLRGLRVEVDGTGNSTGDLVAKSVKFNDTDLRSAQQMNVRMTPAEEQINANASKITAQQGQIEETAAAASRAQASANNAQSTADAARAEADRANNRINGLNDYEPIRTIIVPFATGSSTIGPKGRGIIDDAASWAKTQDRKGWMVEVVGFADSTGNTARNKTLSEKRAKAVIDYLVNKYNMPLTKLVQPFGAGVNNPTATNDTEEGRAANRRVEIRLLLNKGIAGK
jgi:outer membrane protein OmpA-like peptidoglycan-associated protein